MGLDRPGGGKIVLRWDTSVGPYSILVPRLHVQTFSDLPQLAWLLSMHCQCNVLDLVLYAGNCSKLVPCSFTGLSFVLGLTWSVSMRANVLPICENPVFMIGADRCVEAALGDWDLVRVSTDCQIGDWPISLGLALDYWIGDALADRWWIGDGLAD